MYRLRYAIEKLIDFSKFLKHGRGSYLDHCFLIFSLLKLDNEPQDLCLAGLYHSIYGTEFYSHEFLITRNEICEIIGENAEQLVFEFCNLPNRDNEILEKFDYSSPIFKLCKANLKSQELNNDDPVLHDLLRKFNKNNLHMEILNQPTKFSYEKIILDNKEVFIFDNLLERHFVEALNDFCSNSSYKPNQGSSKASYERDERFACHLNKDEFESIRLGSVLQKIANLIESDLYAGSYYINHYGHFAQAGRHTDSSVTGTYTVLIFPNKFWEETWGGGLKLYTENSKFNYVIDYVPGRVLFFDQKIDHEVLPLTINAKKSRYSIAIKCAKRQAIEYIKTFFNNENIIEIKYEPY